MASRKITQPIYMKMGNISETASGIQSATELMTLLI